MMRISEILERSRVSGLAATLLSVLLLPAQPARAQGFTVAQALGYPFPDGLTAAKRGERIAWVFNLRGARNVWVADGPQFAARQVTHYTGDDGMPMTGLRLTPDGRTAVYARGSETNAQGEVADPTSNLQQPEQQVWAADIADGRPRLLGTMNCTPEGCEDIEISPDGRYAVWSGQHHLWLAPISGLTPARPLGYIRGDNSQPRWSPDGKEIAFVSDRGTHALVGIFRLGSATVRYVDPSVFHDTLPRWSADGSKLAFIRVMGNGGDPFLSSRPQPWTIEVWDAASGRTKVIWQSTNDANGSYLNEGDWEDDTFQFAAGARIVFASQEDGWLHLYSIAASGGTPVLLTPGSFSFNGPVTLTADRKAVLYSSNENDVDRRHLWRVDVDRPDAVALTRGASIEWSPVVTGDGRHVAFFGSTATRPAMPYRLTAGGRDMIAADALPATYPSRQFVTPKEVVFRSPDGLQIHGQLFVPRNHAARSPGLIFTHGGPFRQMMLGFHPMDAYNYMYAANEYLASRGFVVLSVNYRLSTGYGRAFREPAHWGPWGASEYQDVVAGARYLQGLPFVDPHRIGLWGGSYGGFLTAMGLARNSDIFKAGVDYAGVHDWTQDMTGASPAMKKIAYQASPVASIATWKSPVLLMQSDDDRDVAFEQTVDLVPRLRAHAIPYELIVFPDETHDSLMWRTWVRNFEATADFFERTLIRRESIRTTPPEYELGGAILPRTSH